MNLDLIPRADRPPADAVPSDLAARLRTVRPSRRTLLAALLSAALAGVLTPFDWVLARREAHARSDPPTTHPRCPRDYDPTPSNWWSGPAMCVGGWRIGPWPCDDGFHFEGRREYGDERYEAYRTSDNCWGRNAWLWGGYRCSDAITETTWVSGDNLEDVYVDITVGVCKA